MFDYILGRVWAINSSLYQADVSAKARVLSTSNGVSVLSPNRHFVN